MDECNELGCTYTFWAPPGPTGPRGATAQG